VIVNKPPSLRPDDTFWKHYAGVSPAVLTLVSGKWIKPKPGDRSMEGFLQLFDFSGFTHQLLTPDGPVTKAGTKTINGQPAIGLGDSGPNPGTLWIAATGAPYPLLVEGKAGSTGGSLTFSEFGQPVSPTPPPANQIVDMSKLGG